MIRKSLIKFLSCIEIKLFGWWTKATFHRDIIMLSTHLTTILPEIINYAKDDFDTRWDLTPHVFSIWEAEC